MGVSPRRLHGWEPREFVEYHFDGDRVVGKTITRESEWDAEQLDLLLAFQMKEADLGPHGQPMSEATDARADPSKPGGWHYVANSVPRQDWAAIAVSKAQDAYYKAWPDASKDGHLWYAQRVDG